MRSDTVVQGNRRYVYRPTQNENGQTVRVSLQFQQNGNKSVEYGVKSFQQLPDGSLGVVFNTEEDHLKFNEIIRSRKMCVVSNQPAPNPYEFRIHRFIAGILSSLIQDEIVRKFGFKLIEVVLQPYSDPRFRDSNFSIVRCNRNLFERVRFIRTLMIVLNTTS